MKTNYLKISALGIATFVASTATPLLAQPAAATPALSYGVAEVVQLSKANVSDDTILAYVHNSANSYGLDASQIIYLKQQGVSDAVVNGMISQHSPVASTAPAPAAAAPSTSAATTATVVQSAPVSSVYVIPDTQTYQYATYYSPYYSGYYPGYYGWGYPAVSLSFGWGGRWGGYHGGYGGGFRGGGHGGGWHH